MGTSRSFPAQVPILALTPSEDTARALALTWGVYSRVDDYFGEDVEFNDVLTKAVGTGAGKGCEIPNFKGSDLGRFPLVSADFWTSDHLSERSRT